MIYIKKWIEYYEELFAIEPNQKEFFENLSSDFQVPSKFLSVECGPALLSEHLSNKHDVTVTDTFSEFINIVNNRNNSATNKIHAFNLNPADIARYLGKSFFNIVYCLNYRLIFMKDRALAQKFLFDSKMLLADGGYLVLDLINFAKYDLSETKIDLPEKKCERATLYSSLIKNSDKTSYQLFQHVVTSSGKVIEEVKDETVYPVSMETIRNWAAELKYSSVEFYSDYNKTPYSKNSDKVICILKK